MFAIQTYRTTLQRAVCVFLAACIVSASLAAGAIGLHSLERDAVATHAQRA